MKDLMRANSTEGQPVDRAPDAEVTDAARLSQTQRDELLQRPDSQEPSTTHDRGTVGGEWRYDLMPIQEEYLEWLCEGEPDMSQGEWERKHDLHKGTVSRWRRTKKFRKAMQDRFAEINSDPLNIQRVLDVVKKSAIVRSDVKGAQLWLQAVGAFVPTTRTENKEVRASDLSDEDLEAAVTDELARRREARTA